MQESTKLSTFKNPVFKYNFDILAICLTLSVVGIYLNGVYALWQICVSALTAVLTELILFKLVIKKNTVGDLSALTTGMLIGLMLPVSAPFYVGVCASVFAIAVAKLPFGDVRNTPFVPAAAGLCFGAMMFSDAVFTYPETGSAFAFYGSEAFTKGETIFDMLSKGGSLSLNVFGRIELLSGAYPGAIGTTSMLALTGVFLFLCMRHPKRMLSCIGYLLGAAAFAFCFPRVNSGRLSSVIAELCAGSLIFVAMLLITDPVTSPRKPSRAFVYGLIAGTIGMLLRYFSKTPDPSCFSVLIINALWPVLSKETVLTKKTPENKKKAYSKNKNTANTKKKDISFERTSDNIKEVPESVTETPEAVKEKPEIIIKEKSDIIPEKPEIIVKEKVDIAPEKPEIIVKEKVDIIPEKPEIFKAEPISEKPEIIIGRHDSEWDKNRIIIEKSAPPEIKTARASKKKEADVR